MLSHLTVICFSDDSKDGSFLWLSRVNVDDVNFLWNNELLRKAQEEDPHLSCVLEWWGKGVKPPYKDVPNNPEMHAYWTEFDRIVIFDGVLYINSLDDDPHPLLLIPHSIREEIVLVMHRTPTGFHFDEKQTYLNLKDFGWFPRMKAYIGYHRRHCTSCKCLVG